MRPSHSMRRAKQFVQMVLHHLIEMVGQDSCLDPRLIMFLEHHKRKHARCERAEQYLAQMQLAWARKFYPPAITGGESQGVIRNFLQLYS